CANSRGTQRKAQRIGSTVHSDAELRVAIFREVDFKSFDHRATDEPGRREHGLENIQQLLLQFTVRCNEINKRNFFTLTHDFILAFGVTARNTFAGFPTTIVFGGTSRVTTLPAPTIAFSPITTLERIVAPDPIDAPFFTSVSSTFQSFSV